MFLYVQAYFSSSKLVVMELVIVILVVVYHLEKVITNLQRIVCEEKRGC